MNTEATIITDAIDDDEEVVDEESGAKVFATVGNAFVAGTKATGHGLKVAGAAVIDVDMRDIGHVSRTAAKATATGTKRIFHGLSKSARQERTVRKANAIKAELRKQEREAKKANKA